MIDTEPGCGDGGVAEANECAGNAGEACGVWLCDDEKDNRRPWSLFGSMLVTVDKGVCCVEVDRVYR